MVRYDFDKDSKVFEVQDLSLSRVECTVYAIQDSRDLIVVYSSAVAYAFS